MKTSEKNLDKIRGALIGGAIGDALGYPVEFMTLDRITSKYGERGISLYESKIHKKRSAAVAATARQHTWQAMPAFIQT